MSAGGRLRPGRLRRRLTVGFLLVAAVSSGALAAASYLLVRQARLSDSLDRARALALTDLRAAGESVAAAAPGPFDVQGVLSGAERSGAHAVLVAGGLREPSVEAVNPPIPAAMAALVAGGDLAYQRLPVGGVPYLMIGARIPGSAGQLYLLFSEQRLARDLAQLRTVLLVGWAGVVVISALVGRALARRTLDPVRRASHAARAMAEGLLDTRLPEAGQDEFGEWAASFNRMAEALEAKVAALSRAEARERRFTSDVAHELRTPVAALVAEASLLEQHLASMPEETRRPAELMVKDVGRLRRLVEELMEISRLDAGSESVRREPVDVPALVQAVVRARGWHHRVVVESDGLTLSTDRRRMERIVANLVGNAVEHGTRDVRVWVGTDAGRAVVEVTDRGPGIPPERLPHLFERFFKGDPSRSGPGSGLGLAIALENARLLGGDIHVWSEVGEGTQFRVLLPVTGSLPGGEGAVPRRTDHWGQESG